MGILKVGLAGNPNSGKTTLFNNLTGMTAHVGNWPGVTVDRKEGEYRKLSNVIQIIDLPGIYSLSPYSPEEKIARDYLVSGEVDCVINIVDATNIERNLYLTTQLLELDVPVVVALNMIDVVKKKNLNINAEALESLLGVPVVEISALKNKGLKVLMRRTEEAALHKRSGKTLLKDLDISEIVNQVKESLDEQNETHSLFKAIHLVENTEFKEGYSIEKKLINNFKETYENETFENDIEALVANERYVQIEKICNSGVKNYKTDLKSISTSDKIDRVLTNKWVGIPIFLVILFFIFHFTFSENFLFIKYAYSEEQREEMTSFPDTDFEGIFIEEGGVSSPGAILQIAVEATGELVGAKLEEAFEKNEVKPWLSGLVVDGIVAGVFSVLSFVPQIILIYLFLSILEDTGYMARVAFILDRIFRKFGLSGRAFIPMIMGFGCSIPAMINTRTLADEKERISTIRVIPFFTCGAKLPIIIAIAGALAGKFKAFENYIDLFTFGIYILGILVAIATVIIMRNTTLRSPLNPFIMELPSYRVPQFKSTMVHLWDKMKHYVKRVSTIILLSTIVIWFLSTFTVDWKFVGAEGVEESILANLSKLVQPIFTPLGFGSQLKTFGWVFVAAAVTGLIAKENVIAMFAILAGILAVYNPNADPDGITAVGHMINATNISVPAIIAFIAYNLTTIPCFAAIASAKAELPDRKSYKGTIAFWLITSYIVGTIIYTIGSWWWTVFIWILVFAIAGFGISIYNKRKDLKTLGEKKVA